MLSGVWKSSLINPGREKEQLKGEKALTFCAAQLVERYLDWLMLLFFSATFQPH
jgi:hypothetical protein